MIFPNDADGGALKTLYELGTDFNKPHVVEFCIAVPDKKIGEKITKLVEKYGFNCSLDYSNQYNDWTCTCSKSMMLVYEDLIKVQALLDEISKPYGGYSDGWGVWGGQSVEH